MKRTYSLAVALSIVLGTACSNSQTSTSFNQDQTGPAGVMPHIVQRGSGSQWAAVPYKSCVGNLISGPQNSIWFGDVCANQTVRVDMAGNLKTFPVDADAIAEGSDGNIWGVKAANDMVSRMTPSGTATLFNVGCIGSGAYLWRIKSGADGNLWITVRNQATIVRMTTAGVVTCFTISRAGSDDAVAGPDGNTWFTEQISPSLLGKITPSGTLTEYPDPNFCGTLVAAGDGYLYCGSPFGVVRISTADASETVVAPQQNEIWGLAASGTGSNARLYYSAPNTHLVTLHLSSLKFDIDVIPSDQHGPRYVAFGPDGNLWYTAGSTTSLNVIATDIFRILTVNPTSMTLTVGQTQTVTASQALNPTNAFIATSANPSVATVANGQTAGTFNITGQGSGSTTVRIADHVHNYVDVAVTVH